MSYYLFQLHTLCSTPVSIVAFEATTITTALTSMYTVYLKSALSGATFTNGMGVLRGHHL